MSRKKHLAKASDHVSSSEDDCEIITVTLPDWLRFRTWSFDRWLAVIGTVVGIAGVIYAVTIQRTNRQISQFDYNIATSAVYSKSSFYPIKVTLPSGNEVGDLDINQSQITIWNAGTTTIRDSEVRTPLTVLGDDTIKIYAAGLIRSKGDADNFTVNSGNKDVSISWKYFDPGDALRIVVLHSGDPKTLSVKGNLGPTTRIIRYKNYSVFLFTLFTIYGSAAAVFVVPLCAIFIPLNVIGWILSRSKFTNDDAARKFAARMTNDTLKYGWFIILLLSIASAYVIFIYEFGDFDNSPSPIELSQSAPN